MAVISKSLGGYVVWTTLEESKHSFIGDEPESLQGTGLGPNPFALLMAALGN